MFGIKKFAKVLGVSALLQCSNSPNVMPKSVPPVVDEHGHPMLYVSIRLQLPSDERHRNIIRGILGTTDKFIAYAHRNDHWHIFIIGEGDVSARYRARILRADCGRIKKDQCSTRYHHQGKLLQSLHCGGRERDIKAPIFGAHRSMQELDALAITYASHTDVIADMQAGLGQVRSEFGQVRDGLADARSEFGQVRDGLADARSELGQMCNGVQGFINETNEEIYNLKVMNKRFKRAWTDSKDENAALGKRLMTVENENQSLRESLELLSKRFQTLEDAVAENNRTCKKEEAISK